MSVPESSLLVGRAEDIVSSAAITRLCLDKIPLRDTYCFHGVSSFSVDKSMVTFQGVTPLDEPLAIDRLLSAIIAGDCVDTESGELVAHYVYPLPVGDGLGMARKALAMSFVDACRVAHTCAAMTEVSLNHLAAAVKVRLGEASDPLKDQPSPDGYLPAAPHWARFL